MLPYLRLTLGNKSYFCLLLSLFNEITRCSIEWARPPYFILHNFTIKVRGGGV